MLAWETSCVGFPRRHHCIMGLFSLFSVYPRHARMRRHRCHRHSRPLADTREPADINPLDSTGPRRHRCHRLAGHSLALGNLPTLPTPGPEVKNRQRLATAAFVRLFHSREGYADAPGRRATPRRRYAIADIGVAALLPESARAYPLLFCERGRPAVPRQPTPAFHRSLPCQHAAAITSPNPESPQNSVSPRFLPARLSHASKSGKAVVASMSETDTACRFTHARQHHHRTLPVHIPLKL